MSIIERMSKKNVVDVHYGILCSREKQLTRCAIICLELLASSCFLLSVKVRSKMVISAGMLLPASNNLLFLKLLSH